MQVVLEHAGDLNYFLPTVCSTMMAGRLELPIWGQPPPHPIILRSFMLFLNGRSVRFVRAELLRNIQASTTSFGFEGDEGGGAAARSQGL